ncbi:MAG: hypothetical protein ABIV21_06370 [Pyrinomonadaceae bacterium]
MENYLLNPNSYRSVGVVRVPSDLWLDHEEAIRWNLSGGRIINVVRVLDNGARSGAFDILLEHRDFELAEASNVPRYDVKFSLNDDGTVTRGPFIKDLALTNN